MSVSRLLSLFLVAVFLGIATPAIAQIGPTGLIGGPGGGDFRDQCDDGSYLVGFNLVVDRDANSIAAVCRAFTDNHYSGDEVGLTTRGNANSRKVWGVRCPDNKAAEQIVVSVSKVNLVHRASLVCRNPFGHDYEPSSSVPEFYGISGESVYQNTTGCGGGAMAVGLIGRYGGNVDALGLLCKVMGSKPIHGTGKVNKPIHGTGKVNKGGNTPPLKVNNGGGAGNGGGGGNDTGADNGNGGGGADTATASGGTTIYKQPNGDDSDANVAGYVAPGSSVTVSSCSGGFCKISKPKPGWVWGEDIGR